jgi:hypothetical protein
MEVGCVIIVNLATGTHIHVDLYATNGTLLSLFTPFEERIFIESCA